MMMMMIFFYFQGQTFIALDPGNFAPNFPEHMETFMQEMRHLEPVSSYSLSANT